MGSLEGHLLPGIFILCFGIWWTYALFDRYFKALVNSCLTGGRIRFKCTATYSNLEGWFKIVVTIIGIFAEFYTALDTDLSFKYIGNSQHITMYIFFLINGIIDVLLYYGYPLPKGSDYLSLCLAAAIEVLLFCFHLHGRTALDIRVHILLIISIIASTISVLIEWKFKCNVLSALFRALCALAQGLWFCTIGFVLYPPYSSPPVSESHSKLMLLTSVFCWEIAAIIVFLLFVGFCFYCKNFENLENREYMSTNNHSDNDLKILMNGSKSKKSGDNFKQIEETSLKLFKYSSINSSEDEI